MPRCSGLPERLHFFRLDHGVELVRVLILPDGAHGGQRQITLLGDHVPGAIADLRGQQVRLGDPR